MALFSFRHSVKTYSEKRVDESRAAQPGQTAAHLRYITRPQAARVVLKERLSLGTYHATAALAEEEARRRKGRVCERFVVALPIEATPEQREALTRAFAERLSKGIAGYVAAIHDQHGNDTQNPHAHFVFFDIQQKTGGRGRPKSTLGFARKNAIENAAMMWAGLHNEMMRAWGYGSDSEITHLSYADRSIDRIPTIHEGASARTTSDAKKVRKKQWKHIDCGYTRADANKVIREINKLKEQSNERRIRLATSDRNNKTQRDGGFAEQRKCGSGHVEAAARNRPPFQAAIRFEPHNREIRNQSRRADQQNPRHAHPRPPFLSATHLGLARYLRRRRGVRRIFHELIMLRDTLKSRLLQNETQRRLPQIDQPFHAKARERHDDGKAKKPRKSGAFLGRDS
jgi:hypothetical protein